MELSLYHPNILNKNCNKIRKLLPLPAEELQIMRKDKLKHFLFELRGCAPKNLPAWIDKLPNTKLVYVFEGIALTFDENTLNRLFLIINQRPGWKLYAFAWHALQKYFPNEYLFKAFRLLASKLKTGNYQQPKFWQKNILDLILNSHDPDDFFYKINQQVYGFSSDELLQYGIDYKFDSNSILWLAIIADFFRECPEIEIYTGRKILANLLPSIQYGLSESIFNRVYLSDTLTLEQKELIASSIFQILPILANEHQIWQHINKDCKRFFKRLAISSALRNHCHNNQDKWNFYRPHFIQILDIAVIAPGTIAMRFPGFILIDNQKLRESIYFYTNNAVESLLVSGVKQSDLGQPSFELPTIHNQPNITEIDEPAIRFDLTQNTNNCHALLNHLVSYKK